MTPPSDITKYVTPSPYLYKINHTFENRLNIFVTGPSQFEHLYKLYLYNIKWQKIEYLDVDVVENEKHVAGGSMGNEKRGGGDAENEKRASNAVEGCIKDYVPEIVYNFPQMVLEES